MPELTRRQALSAVGTAVAGLAGCAGDRTDPKIDHSDHQTWIDDYRYEHVRNEDGAVLFARGEDLPTVTAETNRYVRGGRIVVVTAEELKAVTFNDVPEAEQLQSFATATDFTTESLYLIAHPVDACHEIRLQSVSVEQEGQGDIHPGAQFCQALRPADVTCSTETVHTVGFAIRMPVSAEQSTGSGSGMSSRCRLSPREESFQATVTPVGGDDS